MTDSEDNITAIAELARTLPGIQRVDLLPYHDAARLKYRRLGLAYDMPAFRDVDTGRLASLALRTVNNQLEIKIGG
jgi:pyruvate formate lyase activating enzyme